MLRYLIRHERVYLCAATGLVGLSALFLPEAHGPRTWAFVGISVLLPVLLIGRMGRRNEQGWAEESAIAPEAGRLYLVDLLLALAPAVCLGILGGWGQWTAVVALSSWSVAVICFADLLDRAIGDVRVVWLLFLVSLTLYLSCPLWLAPAFGRTGLAPWLATLTVGLNPAAVVLAAFEQPTLQDPLLYRFTLSGVVEVRPLWWGWGAIVYSVGTALSIGTCIYLRRGPRPTVA